jgi:hypothetical protein
MSFRLKLLPVALCAAALAGCATAPPATYEVANSRVYPWNKDQAFDRVVAASQTNDMFVTASDRRFGVLNVERAVITPARTGAVYNWADCGTMSLAEQPVSQLAELNMVVEPAPGGARVTVNTRFTEMRQDVRNRSRRLNCTSTGVLERQLLEQIAH